MRRSKEFSNNNLFILGNTASSYKNLDLKQFIQTGFANEEKLILKAEELISNLQGTDESYLTNPYEYLTYGEAENAVKIVQTLNSYDKELFYHCFRVALFSSTVGTVMVPDQKGLLFIGGLLHDIGKVFIPNNILYKKERLTDKEFDIIKEHPEIGNDFLMHSKIFNKDILNIAKYHHRKYDGTGYPKLNSGVEVSLLTQIVTVADAFDAMTNSRVYSIAKSEEDAVKELIKCKGTHFNPDVVSVFIRFVDDFRVFTTKG